jgi:hypothetical protein
MLKRIFAVVIFCAVATSLAWGAKTVFVDGTPSLGIKGTTVTAAFLNAVNAHDHHGDDADGSNPQLTNDDIDPAAVIAKSKISTSGTWTNADLPATTVFTTGSYADPAWITSLAGSKVSGAVASATAATSATNATNATTAENATGTGTAVYSAPEFGLKIIRGSLQSDGTTLLLGGGFSGAHTNNSGIYTITFNAPFDSTPVCIAVSNTTTYAVMTSNVSSDTCEVRIYGYDGALGLNGGFSFVAIGPK